MVRGRTHDIGGDDVGQAVARHVADREIGGIRREIDGAAAREGAVALSEQNIELRSAGVDIEDVGNPVAVHLGDLEVRHDLRHAEIFGFLEAVGAAEGDQPLGQRPPKPNEINDPVEVHVGARAHRVRGQAHVVDSAEAAVAVAEAVGVGATGALAIHEVEAPVAVEVAAPAPVGIQVAVELWHRKDRALGARGGDRGADDKDRSESDELASHEGPLETVTS